MTIVITSKRDGFRRCGIAHSSEPTRYRDDFFTDEQLDALEAEPQLILAYARDEVDLVKGPLNDALSQIVPPQTSDTFQITEPQAPQTILAGVGDAVGNTADAVLDGEQSGAPVPGTTDADSTGDAGALSGNQDASADDAGAGGQSDVGQQDAATASETPVKAPAKTGKAKAGKE